MKSLNKVLMLLWCLSFFSCNKDNDCDGTIAIEAVIPNSNPPGTEIKIKGDGFTEPAVRFAGQLAKSELSVEKGLVAIVPNNVIGLVDLTVEDGECLVRTEFEVLGALPVNWVASPTVIVIPTLPATFPSGVNNVYRNVYDPSHTLFINEAESCNFNNTNTAIFADQSEETHSTNPFLNKNPVRGTYNCAKRTMEITIDRRAKGGIVDTFDGTFLNSEIIGEPEDKTINYILLTSRITGRQFVFTTKQ